MRVSIRRLEGSEYFVDAVQEHNEYQQTHYDEFDQAQDIKEVKHLFCEPRARHIVLGVRILYGQSPCANQC